LETASCTRLGLTRTRIEPWQVVRSQTRLHRDLDLALDADNEAVALPALERRGYRLETDWRLVRVELVAGGRGWVDVHPVVFDATGQGRQADLAPRGPGQRVGMGDDRAKQVLQDVVGRFSIAIAT
jgi:Aminoglycoside-2''-adenylyltransferase